MAEKELRHHEKKKILTKIMFENYRVSLIFKRRTMSKNYNFML